MEEHFTYYIYTIRITEKQEISYQMLCIKITKSKIKLMTNYMIK